MSANHAPGPEYLTPILSVRDFAEAVDYYTNKLLFELKWDWGKPPSFGCVAKGKADIFFCLNGQGHPGTWLCVFVVDIDEYLDRISKRGAEIIYGPVDEPWGLREIHVRDPNQHVIRFAQGIPVKEPKLKVNRAEAKARIEKRIAGLVRDLAAQKKMSVGEMLEETLLHTFGQPPGGVASPHAAGTFAQIESLKKKHGLDYDTHASCRFQEKSDAKSRPSRRRK